jgi:hypothetical protein
MTKVTIIGEATPIEKKKPIQFVRAIYSNGLGIPTRIPHEWGNIELICRGYIDGSDLMFAYNNKRKDGMAYLGYFNDGIVVE